MTDGPPAPAAPGRAHSPTRHRGLSLLAVLRRRVRASELWLALIAAAVGALAGLATLAVGQAAHGLQALLYGIGPTQRLSTIARLPAAALLVAPAGGLALGLVTWLWTRRRPARTVDPVEANALHGGRMSVRDSVFLALQSIVSNGSGASVGLEAAYAQLGAAIGSASGRVFNLRRSDLRTLVGAGAGAGIAAAFGAPLTGAFYAFEIIIGSYAVANIAPVVGAALAGALVARLVGGGGPVIESDASDTLVLSHYFLFAALGLACAFIGVAIMRLVAAAEWVAARTPGPVWLRPALGGLALAALAWAEPQTLSAGHGALALDMGAHLALEALALLIIAKAAASIVSLGFGFRGGLFFASLFLGSLVGMGGMAVAIIGGPFTMTFLVLETTGDFALTAATLTAAITASLIVRETFGYSFSTWRLHLRGETIRSAHDVAWLRNLTAGRMMRGDAPTIAAGASIEEFRRRFPLGSTRRVVALDDAGHYAGIIRLATVYAEPERLGPAGDLAITRDAWLTPQMTIKDIMRVFDETESDELAVLGDAGEVLGVLSEAYATRRYAEELEKARRDLVGRE